MWQHSTVQYDQLIPQGRSVTIRIHGNALSGSGRGSFHLSLARQRLSRMSHLSAAKGSPEQTEESIPPLHLREAGKPYSDDSAVYSAEFNRGVSGPAGVSNQWWAHDCSFMWHALHQLLMTPVIAHHNVSARSTALKQIEEANRVLCT